MKTQSQYKSTNITSQTTTLVVTGSGTLHKITFNMPAQGGTVAFYNGVDAGGVLLGTVTIPASPKPMTLIYDIVFGVGLTVVTGTADQDITIIWEQ